METGLDSLLLVVVRNWDQNVTSSTLCRSKLHSRVKRREDPRPSPPPASWREEQELQPWQSFYRARQRPLGFMGCVRCTKLHTSGALTETCAEICLGQPLSNQSGTQKARICLQQRTAHCSKWLIPTEVKRQHKQKGKTTTTTTITTPLTFHPFLQHGQVICNFGFQLVDLKRSGGKKQGKKIKHKTQTSKCL